VIESEALFHRHVIGTRTLCYDTTCREHLYIDIDAVFIEMKNPTARRNLFCASEKCSLREGDC